MLRVSSLKFALLEKIGSFYITKIMGWSEVVIDESSLRNNVRLIRERASGRKVFAVIKSNAYGHGMVDCARIIKKEGVENFAVATIDEAVELREKVDCNSVLLIGGFVKKEVEEIFGRRVTPVVSNFEQLSYIGEFFRGKIIDRPFEIHLEFDTGMGRTGFLPSEVVRVKELIKGMSFLKVTGIMSHFSVADYMDEDSISYTNRQIEIFKGITRYFPGVVRHISNSAGLLFHNALFDAVRVGIAIYGGIKYPGLREVMHVRTRLVEIKEVPENWFISYGRTYKTEKRKRIGIASCGYSLGLWRRFYPGLEVVVRDRRVPVVGVICMDLFVVDLDKVPDADIGDYVYIMGGKSERISVFELAEKAQTVTYEIFCALGDYCKRNRIVVKDLSAI